MPVCQGRPRRGAWPLHTGQVKLCANRLDGHAGSPIDCKCQHIKAGVDIRLPCSSVAHSQRSTNMAAADAVKGYLVLNIIEATGRNKNENFTWDSDAFKAFVKGAALPQGRQSAA